MRTRELTGVLVASALITLDGTAATTALPAIGRSLDLRFSELQWISNASLLMLAALLVPAGALADRMGRGRTMRVGLAAFAVASLACALADSALALLASRLAQGAAAAFVLPGAIATLRASFTDDAQRTRMFGRWAAATGLASAAGPLLGGMLVDLLSWRAVFVCSAGGAAASWLLLQGMPARHETTRRERATRHCLFPRELLASTNCVAGNAATMALYFGVFGLSFLLALYTQQTLGYSGAWSAVAVLPISLTMLLLGEALGAASMRYGTRRTVMIGSAIAAAGVLWIGIAPHPLPFWSHIVAGSTVFGIGACLLISPLTQASVASVSEPLAGAASGLNHAAARAAGLAAITALGSIASAPGSGELSADGLTTALLLCAAFVGVAGTASAALLDDREPGGLAAPGAAARDPLDAPRRPLSPRPLPGDLPSAA